MAPVSAVWSSRGPRSAVARAPVRAPRGMGNAPAPSRPGLFSAVWISVRWAGRIVADGDPTPEMWGSAVLYG